MPVGVQSAATGTFRTHLDTPSTITSHPRTHFNARFGLRRDSAPLGIPPTGGGVELPEPFASVQKGLELAALDVSGFFKSDWLDKCMFSANNLHTRTTHPTLPHCNSTFPGSDFSHKLVASTLFLWFLYFLIITLYIIACLRPDIGQWRLLFLCTYI